MPINEIIYFLNDIKDIFVDVARNQNIKETIKTYFAISSLLNAIEIIKKYQKIKEIVEKWESAPVFMSDGFSFDCMREIEQLTKENNSN